jgi:glycogen debranching enzyme
VFFPYIHPGDEDWQPRMEYYNQMGNYHNGGIWPFICGFYIAALVKAGEFGLAEEKIDELTRLIQISRGPGLEFGFNEWYKAQDGHPMGQDWQTWSAAMYLYASTAVEQKSTIFFEDLDRFIDPSVTSDPEIPGSGDRIDL